MRVLNGVMLYNINKPAFVEFMNVDPNIIEINNDYTLHIDFKNHVASIINLKKEGNAMNEKEIKYTILADDGENIEFEKAIVEHKNSSRSQVSAYRERIESIKAHIVEENEEIARLEAEIAELEKVVAIADEKKAQESQVVEEVVAETIDNTDYQE